MVYSRGDIIPVMVNGKRFDTEIDQNGVQRFPTNTVLAYMFAHDRSGRALNMHDGRDIHNNMLNLNALSVAYQRGKFSLDDYIKVISPGYSVDGFCDAIANYEVDGKPIEVRNPAWDDVLPETPEEEMLALLKKVRDSFLFTEDGPSGDYIAVNEEADNHHFDEICKLINRIDPKK